MKKEYLNISNGLSALRIVLALPLAFALLHYDNISVMILCFAASLTDIGDGYFARKLNQITEFGKIIDPVADKIFVLTFVVIMLMQGRIPMWFMASVFGRDILILLGGLYLTNKLKYVVPSDKIGKAAVSVLGLTLLGLVFDLEFVKSYVIYFSFAVLMFSLANYLLRMVKLLRESGKKNSKF